MSTLWQRQLGNCTKSYLFFQDEKLKYTSPEKADEIRGQMLKDNWRRMDARTEQNRVEQIEDNRIQELNRQEDIQADYYNGY